MGLFGLEGEIGVVTGALGKLGPVWLETLLDAGVSVLAMDRPGIPPTAAFQALQQRFGFESLSFAHADVCRRSELNAALQLFL